MTDAFWNLADDRLASMNNDQFAQVSDLALASSTKIPLRHRIWLAILAVETRH